MSVLRFPGDGWIKSGWINPQELDKAAEAARKIQEVQDATLRDFPAECVECFGCGGTLFVVTRDRIWCPICRGYVSFS